MIPRSGRIMNLTGDIYEVTLLVRPSILRFLTCGTLDVKLSKLSKHAKYLLSVAVWNRLRAYLSDNPVKRGRQTQWVS
jgi:hypothetical protein